MGEPVDGSTCYYSRRGEYASASCQYDFAPCWAAWTSKYLRRRHGSKFSLGKSKDKIDFKSVEVKHGNIKSLAYIFHKTAYISDCKDLSIVDLDVLKDLNYLILDCLKFENHPSHFNFNQVLYISRLLKPKKTILTNLHYDLDYNFLISKLPKNIIPAYDGLKINLWKY